MSKYTVEEKQFLKALSNCRWLSQEEIILWITDHGQPYPLVSYHNFGAVRDDLVRRGFVCRDGTGWDNAPRYRRTEKR
jgi:hypothetical protein